MSPPPPPLLIFADDWGRHPSSCQHLARRLLRRYPIHWINTIGTRPPRLDRATLARGLEKARHWARRDRATAEDREGLTVSNPRMWPWFRTTLDRSMNRSLLLGQLGPWARSSRIPPVAVTTLPIVADLIDALPVSRWVYYCVDDFGQWPGLDREALSRMEELLVRRADVLIAVSEVLRERLGHMGREAHLLTHGVDLEHWAGDGGCAPLAELDGLPRPLIVFWGVVDRRIDARFLARLDADLAEGTILLVGPEQDPDPAVRGLARVARIPPLPFGRLPRLAREAAVLIMPYADLPVTRAIQPLKLKEYLATGRPTVVSDLPATRPWSGCLDLADSPESFSAAVRARLSSGTPAGQRKARARLEAESWEEKARAFERWAIGPEDGPGRAGPRPATAARHGPRR